MKPLNLDNRPCSPISSNCVIWQGPDIACIKLCAGDTVSDVVFALATELCTIMDQLNVSNYDLSCLGINSCPPADFQALIQLLIERICEASGITTSKTETATCPDCVVSVAPCFVEGNQTTMQLVDYVQMIANRVCSILDQIAIINAQIADLLIRVTNLENTPAPAPVNPSFTLGCTIGSLPDGSQNFINVILQEFINNVWCNYVTATGSASDILLAVAAKCIADTDLQLATGTPFSTNPLWIQNASYSTLSDAVNNLWVALCDMRTYLETVSLSVQDTTTVNLTYTSGVLTAEVQDTGWRCLLGFDFYSSDPTMLVKKPQVRRIGNVLHFRGTLTIPLDSGRTPGTVVDWLYKAGTNTYEGISTVSDPANSAIPYQGVGGMSLLSGGSLQFNKGASVIPTSVLPVGYTLDSAYSIGWRMGWRPMDTGSCNTVLTTMTNISIGSSGALTWGVLADLEESFVSGCAAAWSTAHMNYVISNVTKDQHVTDFKTTLNVYDSTLTGNQNAQPDFKVSELYPITINANNQDNLGGFSIILDGLTAFVGPCITSIPTPTLDAAACAGTC